MKIKSKNQANNNNTNPSGRFIVVGNRGTAFCLGSTEAYAKGEDIQPRFPSPASAGIDFVTMGSLHAKGQPCGIPAYDCCLFVGSASPVRIYPFSQAVEKGLVRAVDVTLSGERGVVYVSGDWKQGHKLPKFMATTSLPAGRVETRLISLDKRNAGYVREVRLALVPKSDPTPTPTKGTKGTTPAPTPPKGSKAVKK